MLSESLARFDAKVRPWFVEKMPPYATTYAYSAGRKLFLGIMEGERPEPYDPPVKLSRMMWGIRFRGPLMNAAGMFKNTGGHEVSYRQGAAGYNDGSGTDPGRAGNKKYGIKNPFVPLPGIHSAVNFLGLNNDGDNTNVPRMEKIVPIEGFPIIKNLAESPDRAKEERPVSLARSLHMYADVGVKVFEVNYSCPNTGDKTGEEDLIRSLRHVSKNFIRRHPVVVVAKLSNDTPLIQVPKMLDLLFEFGFHGVNFGNTSTDYGMVREYMARMGASKNEKALLNYFTTHFGGGYSGPALKDKSLNLCDHAVTYRDSGPPPQEFHVWRTGGIENAGDVVESDDVGVSMNFWYTGFFDQFSEHGHKTYQKLHEDYMALKAI